MGKIVRCPFSLDYILSLNPDGKVQLNVTPSAITQRRQTIARRARSFWGDSVLAEVQILPFWRRQAEQR